MDLGLGGLNRDQIGMWWLLAGVVASRECGDY